MADLSGMSLRALLDLDISPFVANLRQAGSIGASGGREIGSGIGSASGPVQGLIDRMTGLSRAETSARESAAAFVGSTRQGFEQLRTSLDPLYANSQKYAEVLAQINVAERQGAASEAEAVRLRDAAATRYLSLASAARGAREGIDEATQATKLNGAQMAELGHIGRSVMGTLLAGGTLTQAAGYEASRVMSVLTIGQGGIMGTVSAITSGIGQLMGTVVSFLGPMGLMTAGLAAIGGLVWYAGFRAARLDIDDAKKSLDALTQATHAFESAKQAASSPFADMLEKYGAGLPQAKAILDNQRQIAQLTMQNALSAFDKDITGSFGKFSIPAVMSNRAAAQTGYATALDNIVTKLQIARPDAVALMQALNDTGAARTPQQVADSLERVRLSLLEASGGIDAMNDKQRMFYGLILDAEGKAYELANIDYATGLNAGAASAAAMKAALADAAAYANVLASASTKLAESNLSREQAEIRLKYGKDASGAARALEALSWDSNRPVGNPASLEYLAWKKMRDQAVANAGVTADLSAAFKVETGSGHKAQTDEQRAELQILKDLHGSAQDYATTLRALDTLKAKGAITQAEYNDQLGKARQRYAETTDAAKFYSQTLDSFEGSATKAILSGKGLIDTLKNLAMSFIEAKAQALWFGTGPLSGGGSSGQPSSSLFGGIVSGLGRLLGMNAQGTSDWRGGLTSINEMGPEIVDLPTGTRIIPESLSKSIASQRAAAPEVRVIVSMDQNANLRAYVQRTAGSVTAAGLATYDGSLDSRIANLNARGAT